MHNKLLKICTMDIEKICERDLKIYSESIGAKLYHYRENDTGVEVDAIIEIADGEYGAIEIKLGGNKEEEAVASLKKFYVLPITALKP